MLKFRSSRLSVLISSLEELKVAEKKLSQMKNKVFDNLHEWSMEETNNTAIQDVTSKLSNLYSNLESSLRQEKIHSLNSLTDLFIKFKEYDSQVQKLNQITKNAQKFEKKCFNEIKKCPATKSIRDYEVKHHKSQQDSKYAQFKHQEFSKEIDATKSILFKTHFKRLNEICVRENEADKVLLTAMKNLVDQIPDVSNEEVDDITKIQYTKQEETNKICNQANKKLTRLSSTRIKLEELTHSSRQVESNTVVLEAVHDPVIEITNETVQTTGVHKNSLYPNLDTLNALNESLNKFGFTDLGSQHSLPPPTYSDSESYYNDQKQPDSYQAVKPTAPSPPPPPSNTFRSVSFNLDRNQINELNSSSDQ